jgi:hypothetical protein
MEVMLASLEIDESQIEKIIKAMEGKAITNNTLKSWAKRLPAVLAGSKDWCYIVEGEVDALSLVEAGILCDQAISVPIGAPQEAGKALRGDLVRFIGPK